MLYECTYAYLILMGLQIGILNTRLQVYQSVSQVDARAYREVHGPRPLLLLGPPLLVSKLMGILEHDPPPAADGPDLRNQRVNHARQPRQPRFQQAVAATTRAPVPGEEDGDHFHFWSRDQLLRAVHEGVPPPSIPSHQHPSAVISIRLAVRGTPRFHRT